MMGLQSDEEKNQAQEIQKKEIAKAYGKYVKAFTPRPKYVSNCLRAFLVGGGNLRGSTVVSERAAGARGV